MHSAPPQTYQQARDYLHSFYAGYDRGVTRARVSDEFLRHSPIQEVRQYPRVVQVTGTNGKGSTCAFVEALLLSAGKQVITATSPHLFSVRERIRIQGEPIRPDAFVSVLSDLHPALEWARGRAHPAPTQVLLWMALEIHRRLGPDCFGVYEVGKGGASDASNIFSSSVVALTSVSEDHLDEFGGSLATLTAEKLGLCRPGGTLVHVAQRPEVEAVIERVTSELRIHTVRASAPGTAQAVTHGMRGEWQASNYALACAAFTEVAGEHQIPVLSRPVKVPGRLEERTFGPHTVLLDVAHNPESLRLLVDHLRRHPGRHPRVAVLGFPDDRPWEDMAAMVVQSHVFSSFIATASCRGRPVGPAALGSCDAFSGQDVIVRPSLKSALAAMLDLAPRELVVFGSCDLCADYENALHALGMERHARARGEIDRHQSWMRPLR